MLREQLLEQYQRLGIPTKIGILVILTAALGYFRWEELVTPAETAFSEAQVEKEKLLADLTNGKNGGGQSLVAVRTALEKANEDLKGLLEMLPRDVEVEKLLQIFADSSRDSGVQIRQFNPGAESVTTVPSSSTPGGGANGAVGGIAPQLQAPSRSIAAPSLDAAADSNNSEFKRMPIALQIDGYFPQVVSFFDKVLSIQRIIRLESLSMKRIEKDSQGSGGSNSLDAMFGQTPRLRVEAKFVTFTQKLGANAFETNTAPPFTQNGPIAIGVPPPNGMSLSAKPLPPSGPPEGNP